MTPHAAASAAAPDGAESATPDRPVVAATSIAVLGLTTPRGIGFPGFRPASSGSSTTSLRAPMDACIASIESASRPAVAGSAPATVAMAAVAREFKSDGKGWTRRMIPATRASAGSREGAGRPSDVDELVEVRDEVLDQAGAAVRDQTSKPRHERPQADRRNDQVSSSVAPDRSRSTTPESEHPFEFRLGEPGRCPEVVDDLDDSPTDDDVAQQLRGPAIDLLVRLVIEPRSILSRIGRQPGAAHRGEYARAP